MALRDEFWRSIPRREDGEIEWPTAQRARRELATDVVGAAFIGAHDHVLDEALVELQGVGPPAGSHDYARVAARATVLASLTPAQREAVESVVRQVSHQSVYWPFVAVRSVANDLSVDLVVHRLGDDDDVIESFAVNEPFDLHQVFLGWLERFSDSTREPDER